jgi:hypothetical protein
LRTVVLNNDVIAGAAARVGIHGEDALVAHLGIALRPVTPHLMAAIQAHLSVTYAEAFTVVE